MDNGLSGAPPHTSYPLFLWPLPHIHPYSDFAHVYLYYMSLNTALLISTYLMVYFENLGPFDDVMG